MARSNKSFGKRPPAFITNAPGGLPNVPAPTRKRKMSLTVGLVALGAAAMVGGIAYESRRREEACRAEAARAGTPPQNCRSSSSSRTSSHWGFSSGSGSSSSGSSATSHSTSTGAPHATFGGFGHSGAAHSGGS